MTEYNGWQSITTPERDRDPKLRAGDADREATAEVLRSQHAEGRLDTHELQARVDVCYHAKTLGELDQLLADLPRRPATAERPAWQPNRLRTRLLAVVPIVAALVALSAVTGRHLVWLVFPLVLLTTRLAGSRRSPWWA